MVPMTNETERQEVEIQAHDWQPNPYGSMQAISTAPCRHCGFAKKGHRNDKIGKVFS